MEIRFLIDLDTGLSHIGQHGVDEAEVVEVLRWREQDAPGRDGTRIAEGQSASGRYLRVIYRINEVDGTILVITAYDLTGNAKRAFLRRRRRRKGK